MWMTPILWNIDSMPLNSVILFILKLNPMYYIVSGYRDALITKFWFSTDRSRHCISGG